MTDIHLEPCLLTGTIVNVTDMGVVIELKGRMGMLHLPKRSIISDKALVEGLEAQIWISYAQVLPTEEKEN